LAWEWLWRGRVLATANATRNPALTRQLARAKACADQAASVLANAEGAAASHGAAMAASLWTDAIQRCLAVLEPNGTLASDAATQLPNRAELERLLLERRDLLLEICEQSPSAAERLQQRLLTRDFEDLATSSANLKLAAIELQAAAEHLLRRASPASSLASAALAQRLRRITFVLLVVTGLVCGWFAGRDYYERKFDLSRGKPWQASSMAQYVCVSPERACLQRAWYFFHTYEDASPWLKLDLGQVGPIGALRVDNRRDCCGERALPLVFEVSSDGVKWQEVVRRVTPFTTWRASFPKTQARYVRFRVARKSFLHLYDVRILP
jgi:hypothetical protein